MLKFGNICSSGRSKAAVLMLFDFVELCGNRSQVLFSYLMVW